MEIKPAFKISGKYYDTKEEAEQRLKFLFFNEWYYQNNELYGTEVGGRVDFDDLFEWLHEHEKEVKKILKLKRNINEH